MKRHLFVIAALLIFCKCDNVSDMKIKTDVRLNGEWFWTNMYGEVTEIFILNNGEFEHKDSTRGTYTTNNGKLVMTILYAYAKNEWIKLELEDIKINTINYYINNDSLTFIYEDGFTATFQKRK